MAVRPGRSGHSHSCVRGAVKPAHRHDRVTPACAGVMGAAMRARRDRWSHSRSRGHYPMHSVMRVSSEESLPLARALRTGPCQSKTPGESPPLAQARPGVQPVQQVRVRVIPAYADSSTPASTSPPHPSGHSHSRGLYAPLDYRRRCDSAGHYRTRGSAPTERPWCSEPFLRATAWPARTSSAIGRSDSHSRGLFWWRIVGRDAVVESLRLARALLGALVDRVAADRVTPA